MTYLFFCHRGQHIGFNRITQLFYEISTSIQFGFICSLLKFVLLLLGSICCCCCFFFLIVISMPMKDLDFSTGMKNKEQIARQHSTQPKKINITYKLIYTRIAHYYIKMFPSILETGEDLSDDHRLVFIRAYMFMHCWQIRCAEGCIS